VPWPGHPYTKISDRAGEPVPEGKAKDHMPKTIAILLDGTSNEIKCDRSNVLRLYGTLQKNEEQLVLYDPGVGTFGSEGAWSRLRRKGAEVWGLATGWGLDENVKQSYRFLVENYERGKGGDDRDRIAIFGFSRGAYTARVLAGFINAFGLMERQQLNLLDYAYRAYKRIGEDGAEDAFAEIRLFDRIVRPDHPPIRFLGLFDTVASVIENGRSGIRLKSHAFTSNNRSVETVVHAVAIDEKRTMFRPQLWGQEREYHAGPFDNGKGMPQDVHEVWFAGGHGDVGGGYPEQESALCKVPLLWMIDHAERCGLRFSMRSVNSLVHGKYDHARYVPPDPQGAMHDTMTLGWSVLEFLPRKLPAHSRRPSILGIGLPLFEARYIPAGASIHTSVSRRIERTGYQPENLRRSQEP